MNDEENIRKQLEKIYEKSNIMDPRIANLLSLLDFGDSNLSVNTHFSPISIAKLYIYNKIKHIGCFPELIKHLMTDEQESFLLGFFKDGNNNLDLPKKRTYDYYLKEYLDKNLLDKIVEEIIKCSAKNSKILDTNLVKKSINSQKQRFDREKEEAIKLMRKLCYEKIPISIRHNGKYTGKELLDFVAYLCYSHDFAHGGSKCFERVSKDCPSGDTLLYHLSKLNSFDEIKKIFEDLLNFIFLFAKRNCHPILRNRSFTIAYDVHKIPYYGKGIKQIRSDKADVRGTSNYLEFLTCSIVDKGMRLILDVIPYTHFDNLSDMIDESLKRIKKKIKIDMVLMDRGFDKIKVYNALKNNRVLFLNPKIKSDTVKAAFDKSEFCKSRVFENFKIGEGLKQAKINLIIVEAKNGDKHAFACNFKISPVIAHRLYEIYSKRWGIETSYRMLDHDFQAKTTSQNYNLRLFYFLFSVCLFNLWVLVNLYIGLVLYGKIPLKPTIRAKEFLLLISIIHIKLGDT